MTFGALLLFFTNSLYEPPDQKLPSLGRNRVPDTRWQPPSPEPTSATPAAEHASLLPRPRLTRQLSCVPLARAARSSAPPFCG